MDADLIRQFEELELICRFDSMEEGEIDKDAFEKIKEEQDEQNEQF